MIAAFMLAQVPFGLSEWVAIGSAPGDSGTYDVFIQATYGNSTGTFPLQIAVGGGYNYTSENLTVEPVYPFTRTQPILLRYDIKVNGSKTFTMIENNVTIYYVSDQTVIGSQPTQLIQAADTYWYVNVTVPFKGDYEAVVSIILQKNNLYYGGQFVSQFRSDDASPSFVFTPSVSPQILTPAEDLEVSLEATFEGIALEGLDLFKANLYGTLKDLVWDAGTNVYDADFNAPTEEGIYLLSVYAEDQDSLVQLRVYVAEIARAKSARCPAAMNISGGCTDMKDVRKCVSDWKADLIQVSEDQIVLCFESATGGLITGSVICDPTWRGDLDGDEELDLDDLDLMENTILPLSQSVRDDYLDCADYDLDGDVDDDDLTCLTNVVSGEWSGGFNGGICFDAEYDTPLACDLNNDDFITDDDKTVLQDLIAAADEDVEMPQEVLDTCDFNQDGQINIADENCISHFIGLDLGNPNGSFISGGQTIPSTCMNVYNLDNCQGIKGDINGDIVIDAVDEWLIMLIEADQITGYNMGCADVNGDGRITSEDVICVKAYTAGNREEYFICLDCDENTPAAYLNTYEICGDGYDNDCDGFVDRTSTSSGDLCLCTDQTPCWMVKDTDGGTTPGVGDGKVKVCRKTSWSTTTGNTTSTTVNVSGYSWVDPSALTCGSDKQCKSMECKDTEYHCAYDGTNWNWYDDPADLPWETNDGTAVPKLCGDTFDNDCSCGDTTCRTEKKGSMFKSSEFWIGAAVGLVVGWYCPPCAMYLSLGATGGSMLTNDASTQAALTGFSIGVTVGSFASTTETGTKFSDVTKGSPGSSGTKGVQGFKSELTGEFIPGLPPTPATPTINPTSHWFSSGSNWGLNPTQLGVSQAIGGAAAIGGYMNANKNYKEKKAEWNEHINASCPGNVAIPNSS